MQTRITRRLGSASRLVKRRGRPSRTWFDGIRETMKKRGIEKEWSLGRARW